MTFKLRVFREASVRSGLRLVGREPVRAAPQQQLRISRLPAKSKIRKERA